MKKFSFDEPGVQLLLAELYQLPDDQLNKEADALKTDYRKWVENHFLLATSQLSFLKKIDDRFINEAALYTSSFLIARLPITLVKAAKEATAAKDGDGKIIDLDKKSSSRYSDESGFEEEETLIYTISYQ
jgi:hypothetical protein